MLGNNLKIKVDSGTAVCDYGFAMKGYTTGDVLNMLKARQAGRTQREFAAEIGITQQYLCDVLQGNRKPGRKMLDYLGLEAGFIKPKRAA